MIESENPNPSRNGHTETASNTKLTMKERISSYMFTHSPFIQILLSLFVLGAIECLLAQVPIPLFKIFGALGLPTVSISVAGLLFLTFCDYLIKKGSRKR